MTFVLDRAGVTGPDGASHHGMWDLSVFSHVPGLQIAAPRDAARLTELLTEAAGVDDGPTLLRFLKGSIPSDLPVVERVDGVDNIHRSPAGTRDVLVVAVGPMVHPACEAATRLQELGVGVTVVDPRWVLPVSAALVDVAVRHKMVVTIEDGLREGGVGTAVLHALQEAQHSLLVIRLGLRRMFLDHGERPHLLKEAGLSAEGIVNAVLGARTRNYSLLPDAAGVPAQRLAPVPRPATPASRSV
ncbi:hypothetical protein GCM10010339_47530 [Streptomyces alanosinicus]|uniref:1-deoxy-D-xylulose-5-phosphate synthase n=1 Tax=Streptomyces alanosinicus TaxID=68171 RepID=A0A919D5E7_9ACTN|nr:hypothetical protein GCM10010339_47530 [Streptomyces alanosinicus]